MKYIILFLISMPVFAKLEKSAYEKYSATESMTTVTKITWETVNNPEKICNELRIKQTGKPYTYKVDACSSWTKNLFNQYTCHIITGKSINNDILGHEVRHCFQGNFHK